MGERTVLEIAERLREGRPVSDLRGLCYLAAENKAGDAGAPPYEEAAADPAAFAEMFLGFYRNQDPLTAQGLCQRQGAAGSSTTRPSRRSLRRRWTRSTGWISNGTSTPTTALGGEVRALETIRFAIPTHRGCYGECHFCAIAVHEGRTVSSRSEASILREAEQIAALPDFKGYILDVGGPTANMYGIECEKKAPPRGLPRAAAASSPPSANRSGPTTAASSRCSENSGASRGEAGRRRLGDPLRPGPGRPEAGHRLPPRSGPPPHSPGR